MKTIKAILVDDEPRGLTSLEKLLQINCPEVNVIACCDDPDEARDAIRAHQPDVVFLDVAMPGKNGFDLLKDLQPVSFEIIFVTAYNHYMTQAFRYSAIDYLLKPVDDELLIEAVRRATNRVEQKAGSEQIETFLHNIKSGGNVQKLKICIHSMKGFQVIELKDIMYCEASGNYTNFYFANRSFICASRPIHEYETMLEDSHFVRVHKSYIVNIEFIREYVRGEGGSLMLSNGQEIEVSRRKKELLIGKLKEQYKY